jgi:hypothetical protein
MQTRFGSEAIVLLFGENPGRLEATAGVTSGRTVGWGTHTAGATARIQGKRVSLVFV